jgi:hypothetical protein
MKLVFLAILLILAASLQLAVLGHLNFFGAVPNLILALALSLAILKEGSEAKWFVLALAIFYDLAASLFFGPFSLNIFIVFCLVRWLSGFVLKQSGIWAIALSVFAGITGFEALKGIFSKISLALFPGYFYLGWSDFIMALPANLICNFLLSLLVLYALKNLFPNLLRMASKRKKRASFILPND